MPVCFFLARAVVRPVLSLTKQSLKRQTALQGSEGGRPRQQKRRRLSGLGDGEASDAAQQRPGATAGEPNGAAATPAPPRKTVVRPLLLPCFQGRTALPCQ